MKFMINGAVTLGTLDGANVEIHEAVGDDNILLFGMKTPEVVQLKKTGYNPRIHYDNNPVVRNALNELSAGIIGVKFNDIVQSLVTTDPYMVLADFEDYTRTRKRAAELYTNPTVWNRMSLMNIAMAGRFSSDRAIQEYADNIWGATPVK